MNSSSSLRTRSSPGLSRSVRSASCLARSFSPLLQRKAANAIPGEGLSPAQMFLIGLIEDARVEYRAAKAFPGLKKLWGRLLATDHEGATEHATVPLLERFAHCLNDDKLHINDAGLDRIAGRFHKEIKARQHDKQFSRYLGMELFELLANFGHIASACQGA